MKPQYLVAGAATLAVSVVSGYMYAKPVKELSKRAEQQGDSAGCAFDRLAGIYDDVIGSEERYMWYGLFRKWLIRKAQGDVLEISAGTGRNLPHYKYSNISSLTLTDVSQPMLQQAQNKFFEDLQLQYKHPELTVKFLLADAEKLVAEDKEPVTVPLHVHKYNSSSGDHDAAERPSRTQKQHQQQEQQSTSSVWRFKRQQVQEQQQQQELSSTTSTAEAGSDHSSSDSSSNSWWGRKRQQQQQQQQSSALLCGCQSHTGSSNNTGDSSSSSSSSIVLSGSTFVPGSFDVVVDTFGLCSCDDPVQVLQQASRVLKPGGKLLLLEHGRSSWSWLNEYMDKRAAAHHKTYGCWFNRDIEDIVRKAGLDIESSSRWHFGTSYLVVASPAQTTVAAAATGGGGTNVEPAMAAAAAAR